MKKLFAVGIISAFTLLGSIPAHAFVLIEPPTEVENVDVLVAQTIPATASISVSRVSSGMEVKAAAIGIVSTTVVPFVNGKVLAHLQIRRYINQICYGTGDFDSLEPGDITSILVRERGPADQVVTVNCQP